MTALPRSELTPILVGLGLAMLLSALDQTIVAAAMPSIAAQFADYEHLSWIVTAYLVAGVVATPLYGKLADIHGARIMMLIGVAIFMAGSLACALAPGMVFLAAARLLQGLGGGALISLAQTLIAELVTPQERGRYQTYFSAVFVASSIAGPILGGLFSQYAHWSLIFWINLPLGAAAWIAVDRRLAALPVRSHPHALDYPGAALLALASGALVLSLGRDGAGPSLPLAAVSLAAFLAFARRQRTAPEPMIPLSILTEPVIRNATVSSSFGLGTFVGLSVTAPLYFQNVLGLTASQSGLALIPIMAATVTGATISGRTMASARSYKTLPLAALAAARRRRHPRRGFSAGVAAGRARSFAHPRQFRRRRHASGGDRLRPERRAPPRSRLGDGGDAVLPAARLRDHRRPVRRADRPRRRRGGRWRGVSAGPRRDGDLRGAVLRLSGTHGGKAPARPMSRLGRGKDSRPRRGSTRRLRQQIAKNAGQDPPSEFSGVEIPMHAAASAGRTLAAALLVAGALGAAPSRAADDKPTTTAVMEMLGISSGEDVSKIDYSERPRLALPGGARPAPEKPAQKGQPRQAAAVAPVVSGSGRSSEALIDPPAAYKVPTKNLDAYGTKSSWWNPMTLMGGDERKVEADGPRDGVVMSAARMIMPDLGRPKKPEAAPAKPTYDRSKEPTDAPSDGLAQNLARRFAPELVGRTAIEDEPAQAAKPQAGRRAGARGAAPEPTDPPSDGFAMSAVRAIMPDFGKGSAQK